jgi:tetratricopeptide (TPR) repeat protein
MNRKIRNSLLVVVFAGLSNLVFAQSAGQGKKFFYYGRYNSAKDALEKALAANPNDIEAVYWLGETLLEMKDSLGAQALIQKALQTNGNAPLLVVGMGHVELRMGKPADAHQHFEAAIALSKGKDVATFNAIGRSIADPKVKDGDYAYAIEKLNLATQVKKFNDPETYVILGDIYRKQINGGDAVTAYQKALGMDPKLAEAKFKTALIYLTQNNKDYFLPAFDEAVEMDPAYTPAYYQLFYYWYFRDVNKAAGYLDKYIANADPGPETEYLKTDFLYASSKFEDAKTKALGLISQQGDKVSPRMYKMVAYVCDTLGDVACAKQYITTYFSKQDTGAIVPPDYEERAHIHAKDTDTATMISAFDDYKLAIMKDTLPENKTKYMNEATVLAKRLGNKKVLADMAGIAYASKKDPNNADLFGWGIANYQAANYKTSDSIFCGMYETKYPTEVYGYLWCARSKRAEDDSVGSQGLAVGAYDKLAQFARGLDSTAKAANGPDSIKYRSQILDSYFYLAGYYNDIKKDKQMAIFYLKKIIEVDPANTTAPKYIGILERPARQPAPAKPKPASTGTTGTHSSSGTR